MNLKEKLMEDHPQLSELKIDQLIEEAERKVDKDENLQVLEER